MKNWMASILVGLTAATLLTGCVAVVSDKDSGARAQNPTVGQQLIDLQKAKDSGALSPTEYEAAKAKLLSQ